MKLARYMGAGNVEIVAEPKPQCPPRGLLVKTEACGLCSGELMDWYMDRKIPHVLGHEVAGIVEESEDDLFPVGGRVFPHHHAPCLVCEHCRKGRHVHCDQWKRTKLIPGGMSEYFGVQAENLSDTLLVGNMRPVDAALIEPLACVVKSLRHHRADDRAAVIGLGVMGLMHSLVAKVAAGIDVNHERVAWAREIGVFAFPPDEVEPGFDFVAVCPGSQTAFEYALKIANPGARVVMFAPLPPGESLRIPQDAYFKDIELIHSYSCGPNETMDAKILLEKGMVRAEQLVSDFIRIDDLPRAYGKMKAGEILKPMVLFDT